MFLTFYNSNIYISDILGGKFPGRWIAYGRPNSGPHNPPDIASLDFFLSRYVKDYLYGTSVDVTAILHTTKIKEIPNVAEC